VSESGITVVGVDVGTECIKAIVLKEDGAIVGRTVVPTQGRFQDRVREAMDVALDEAQVQQSALAGLCATGFGAKCVEGATMTAGETSCHALGAFRHHQKTMCVVDIGGRDPKVIHVDGAGRPTAIHAVRRCAFGIGTFLMFASRHLDVHPAQLQELAAAVDAPAVVGSYCSVFSGSEILERLREGVSREEIALGCMHSVAERITEIGGFENPLRVTGGVAEYFPGVLKAFAEMTGLEVEAIPEPITAGALGAALKALQAVEKPSPAKEVAE
jgi:predicted CoA-substrate-specific enzyme activase